MYISKEVRYENVALVEWLLSGQQEETWKKTAVVAFHPPRITHEITSTWTRGSPVRRKHVSNWVVACPSLLYTRIYVRHFMCAYRSFFYIISLVHCAVLQEAMWWNSPLIESDIRKQRKIFSFCWRRGKKIKTCLGIWIWNIGVGES